MTTTPAHLHKLAHDAVAAMLAQRNVTYTHKASEERNGRPLPVKRMDPDAAGNVTQEYRPLAMLEWVNDQLTRPAEPEPLALPALGKVGLSPLAPLPAMATLHAVPALAPFVVLQPPKLPPL